jgi:hypothetical protein
MDYSAVCIKRGAQFVQLSRRKDVYKKGAHLKKGT